MASLYAAVNYAVAVRDGPDLLTVLTLERGINGDVYSNIARPHIPDFKPHTSYHASGQRHAKSFNGPPMLRRHLQRPDRNFRGTEQVENVPISPDDPRAINLSCQRSNYDDVFEIPYDDLKSTKQGRLRVDLAERGAVPPPGLPTERVICRKTFDDDLPWIIVTLIDI
jgi:hypothetical protein